MNYRWSSGLQICRLFLILFALLTSSTVGRLVADDWVMLGRDATRNPVSTESDPPTDWDPGRFHRRTGERTDKGQSIRWIAELGTGNYASPVISDGLVWIGSNRSIARKGEAEYLAALLRCYREDSGELLFEFVSPRLGDNYRDPPWQALSCSPSVDRDQIWFLTNRCEVVSLDISPLKQARGEPIQLWRRDLKELGINLLPLWMWPGRICSVSQPYSGRIYVTIPNGVDDPIGESYVPMPEAPCLACLDAVTGKVLWTDNSPGTNMLYSEFSSPLVGTIGGRGQVIVAQGDGWVRSFDPIGGDLLWEFDINPKTARYAFSSGERNYVLATPVLYDGRIYIASGRQASRGGGAGRLVCIDPTKDGDISSELAVDRNDRALPRRRLQGVDVDKEERAIANPNSGLIWEFSAARHEGDDPMNRTLSSVAVHDDLVIAPDFAGMVHCLDAQSGEKYWTYDAFYPIWGSPLIIGDLIYLANEEGEVNILRLSRDAEKAMDDGFAIHQIDMRQSIYMSPVFANGTLYVTAGKRLFSIRGDQERLVRSESLGSWPQWRGPNRDNKSSETGLLKSWPETGPALHWQTTGIGHGISSVSIAGGRVFTVGYVGESEFAICLDQQSGTKCWAKRIGPAVRESPSMRWLGQRSPTVDDELVYFVRSDGDLVCLQADDGAERWRVNYVDDFGAKPPLYGFCDYPLIDGDRLISVPGGQLKTVAALNKHDGTVVWTTSLPDVTKAPYTPVVRATFGGVTQYVVTTEGGIFGVAAEDGRQLWRYTELATHNGAIHTPFIIGDQLFCPGAIDGEMALLEVRLAGKEFLVNEIYRQSGRRLERYQDNTVIVDGNAYAFQLGSLPICVAVQSGEILRQPRRRLPYRRCAVTFADGHLYVRGNDGSINLVKVTPQAYNVVSTFSLPGETKSLGVTNPVIAGGSLYVRDNERLYAYALRSDEQESKSTKVTLRIEDSKRDTAAQTLRSVFVATPRSVVDEMLKLAKVSEQDVVVDLGSGDGRIVIAAAGRYGCRAIGYEIDGRLIQLSRENAGRYRARSRNIHNLVTFKRADLYAADLSEVTVVTAYLLPDQLEKLLPKFGALRPGVRIVSHQFEIPGHHPEKTVRVDSESSGYTHSIHLYTTPLEQEPNPDPE